MNVVIFGASGMVGQGVLRECLADADVTRVTLIVRSPLRLVDKRAHEIRHADFADFSSLASDLAGTNACFFCLGATSLGLTEEQYRRVTLDVTAAAARTLAAVNPAMTFVFVSGKGSDSTEKGSVMWARVKGAAENVVLKTFPNGYAFRPGFIQPLHGITSRTQSYRMIYALMAPFMPLLRRFKSQVTTTEQIGRAMLAVARRGYAKRVLESEDINAVV